MAITSPYLQSDKRSPNPHTPLVCIYTTVLGGKNLYILSASGIYVSCVSEHRENFPYILLTEWIL
jgi:hypothetical protein